MQSNDKIGLGQTVRLKSGGPLMTTINFYDNPMILCGWFDGTEYKHNTLSSYSLVKVPYEGGSADSENPGGGGSN